MSKRGWHEPRYKSEVSSRLSKERKREFAVILQPSSTHRWACTRCPRTWKTDVRRGTCPYCGAGDKEL